MTESMNLDPTDIVGALEEFESLETIEAELDILNHEDQEEKEIITTELDMMPTAFVKDGLVVKQEVDEIQGEELMEETITYDVISDNNSMMENVMDIDHQSVASSEMQNDNIFSEEVIGEEIVSDEQVVTTKHEPRIFDDTESEKEFDDFDDMMSNNVVSEETIIGDCEEMETEKIEIEIPGAKMDLSASVVTSGVYVVSPSGTLTPTLAQSVLPNNLLTYKAAPQKLTRVVLPRNEIPTGQPIRLMTSQSNLKTFTLEEAKQLGLINVNMSSSKGGVGKVVMPKKTVTVVKSPAKILPAPPRKVVIRSQGGCTLKPATTFLTTGASGTTPSLIRIPASQIPTSNKQVQYVKLIGGGKMGQTTTLVPVSLSSKTIPVALPASLLNSQPATFKVVPMSAAQQSVTPVLTNTVQTGATPRLLIPAPAAPSKQQQQQQQQQQQPQQQQQVNNVQQQPTIVATVASANQHLGRTNIVMVQSGLFQQATEESSGGTVRTIPVSNGKRASTPVIKMKEEVVVKTEFRPELTEYREDTYLESNGIRPRKPCNCTKSMCLKLYCDCFANGEFCHQCNCTTCYNNLNHEEERQRAIKSCLERNPTAFRPKIGKTFVGSEERRHNKGCNCRRSGCLKNYCECYEAKIPCSKNCKCVGCKNTENFLKRGISLMEDEHYLAKEKSENMTEPPTHPSHRQVLNLSPQLVEATCQCLVAQVEDWAKGGGEDMEQAQTLVIEELGRCLSQLIDCVNRTTTPS